ncbi:MAG: hypothetical protein JO102_01285 [Elusimicrobia bacterium]|nr:hypothetical protein [Elusimicrobiota bacterium]
MKNIRLGLLIAAAISAAAVVSVARAGGDHNMPPYEGSKEFQTIKKLQGHWEGTSSGMAADKSPQKMTVDYKVTSNGSAVVETLFPGTPHEMVSVYTDENGKLAMTHYCSMANQPHMALQSASGNEISLAVAPTNGNVDPATAHMHALTLQMPKPDQLVQKWTSWEGGKEKDTSTFTFTRKS